MSAPLIFVRDGRTLPFVPVTTAALAAIHCVAPPRRRAYARSLYLALLEIANEGQSDRAAVSRKRLAERGGCSTDLVSDIGPLLKRAGVVRITERTFDGQRLENEWVVVEPDQDPAETSDPRGSQPLPPEARSHDPEAASHGNPDVGKKNPLEGGEPPSPPKAAKPDPDDFPAELPEHLVEVAIAAGKILKRTAIARGQRRPVTRAAVGHAVLSYPDRDHMRRALDLEGWILHGRGQRVPCRDIVARYRNFLDDSDPMPPQAAAGTPSGRGGTISSSDLRDAAARLREQGQ